MDTIMDTIKVIKSRTSIRKYKPVPVPREILADLVDCARLAPTGYNQQPWVFVVVTEQAVRSRIAQAARWGKFIQDAGACIAVFCRIGAETMLEDACAATENMIIAAQAYGLGTCWVNSHQKAHSEAIKRILSCPAEFELVTLLAVGYPAEVRQAAKKPLDEVIRWEGFGGL